MIPAQRQRFARIRQMLDDVEQNDDIHLAEPLQGRRVRHALQNIQTRAPAVFGGLGGEFDAGDVEIARRLHEKEPVGASELKQLAALAVPADEIDAAGKLAAQHRLCTEVVGVAIGVAAGKIVVGVVGGGIESGRFRAA